MPEEKVSSQPAVQSPPANSSSSGSKKIILIVLILVMFLLFCCCGGSYLAYRVGLFENSSSPNQDNQDDENNDADRDQDEDSDSDSEDEEEEDDQDEDSDIDEEVTLLHESLHCVNIYGTEYDFTFSYREDMELQVNDDPSVEGDECEIALTYMDGVMSIGADQGEGFASNFNEGDYEIIGDVITATGYGDYVYSSLIRLDSNQLAAYPDYADFYRYQYGSLSDDCEANELYPDLRSPCGSVLHPSGPGARVTMIEVPVEEVADMELSLILKAFDEVALTFETEYMY